MNCCSVIHPGGAEKSRNRLSHCVYLSPGVNGSYCAILPLITMIRLERALLYCLFNQFIICCLSSGCDSFDVSPHVTLSFPVPFHKSWKSSDQSFCSGNIIGPVSYVGLWPALLIISLSWSFWIKAWAFRFILGCFLLVYMALRAYLIMLRLWSEQFLLYHHLKWSGDKNHRDRETLNIAEYLSYFFEVIRVNKMWDNAEAMRSDCGPNIDPVNFIRPFH